MADRMTELLAIERELVADLSHRLRTPLTALHLATERMGASPESGRVEAAVGALEAELQAIITAARTPLAMGPMGRALRDAGSPSPSPSGPSSPSSAAPDQTPGERCEAGEVIRRRAGFWAVLAAQQDRACTLDIAEEATTVDLAHDDIAAVVDALVGNVFRYTADGAAFAIAVDRTAQAVELRVEDAGPGIPDPDAALARGSSTSSTGLGLDIVRRAASATGGTVHIARAALGGASVRVTFGLSTDIARSTLRGAATRRQAASLSGSLTVPAGSLRAPFRDGPAAGAPRTVTSSRPFRRGTLLVARPGLRVTRPNGGPPPCRPPTPAYPCGHRAARHPRTRRVVLTALGTLAHAAPWACSR